MAAEFEDAEFEEEFEEEVEGDPEPEGADLELGPIVDTGRVDWYANKEAQCFPCVPMGPVLTLHNQNWSHNVVEICCEFFEPCC